MKNITLGKRMAGGFGILVLVAVLLGGFAVYKMSAIEADSTLLARELVPEVSVCNEIERSFRKAMLDIRTYGLTFDDKFLESGKANLGEVKKQLVEAKELANRSPHLVKLKENLAEVEARLSEYEKMVGETDQKSHTIERERNALLEIAGNFMKISEDFLLSQNEQMRGDIKAGQDGSKLEDRLGKITVMSEIVNLGSTIRIAVWRTQAQRDLSFINQTPKNFEQIEKKLTDLRALTKKAENLKQIDGILTANSAYKERLKVLLDNWRALDEVGKKRRGVTQKALDLVESTAKAGTTETAAAGNENASRASYASRIMIIGLIAAAILGSLLAVVITLSLTRPIRRMTRGLSEGASQVATASNQVASTSQQLAEGASEQAATLEEISSTMEEMASNSRKTTDLTDGAAQLMTENIAKSATSLTALIDLTIEMGQIEQDSEKIGEIIKSIDAIAFQTNLLALNAAVEAARAGEAGAGFAVVAGEVRNLAGRATEAAKNTQDLLEDTVGRVKKGAQALRRMSDDFDGIVRSATVMGEKTNAITLASKAQSYGLEQMSQAVHQIDTVTQQNAASSEESAAAAEELNAQAEASLEIARELAAIMGEDGLNNKETPTRSSIRVSHIGRKVLESLPYSKKTGALGNRGNKELSLHHRENDLYEDN